MVDTVQKARQLAHAKRFAEATSLLSAILAAAPDDREALHLLACVAEYQGDRARAADILRRAASAHPNDFVVHAHLSGILRELGRLTESISFGRRAAALKPNDPVILNDLALAYMQRGDPETAKELLSRAVQLAPDLPNVHNNLGLAAQQLGQLADAAAHFEQVIALGAAAAGTYLNLLDCYTVRSREDRHLKEVESRLGQTGLDDSERSNLLFAAAKAHTDLGHYRQALEFALKACELTRRDIQYDEPTTLRLFEDVRRIVSPGYLQRMRGGGSRSTKPIFIVSMPRAGSTLVEQVLSSHPSVFGGGELADFPQAVDRVRAGAPLIEFLDAATPEQLSRIGDHYIESITRRAPDALHVTDKMPANFIMAGVVHLALPDAKIIHVRRDPVDTCVSCLASRFTAELNHTYDQRELGRYYRAYNELMNYWRAILPDDTLLDVRYEDLVDNFEAEARRLFAFCNIPWDEAVTRFQENRRPVATRSLAQVRQPLYKTSIGRWRAFDDLLRPLLRELGPLADSPS